MLDEYVMLALRSSGLDIKDFKEKFSRQESLIPSEVPSAATIQEGSAVSSFNPVNWIKEKNDYFILLKNQNLLEIDDHFIRLTKKGYAVCDEILGNLL